jgi:hypothetical protein
MGFVMLTGGCDFDGFSAFGWSWLFLPNRDPLLPNSFSPISPTVLDRLWPLLWKELRDVRGS